MSPSPTEPEEAGFSLVEMMVATALLGMLFTAVLAAMLPLLRVSTNTTNGTNDVGEVQSAMDVVTRDIRAALASNGVGPVVAGTATSLTVVTNTGTSTADPEVVFTLTGTKLSESDYAYSSSTSAFSTTPFRTATLSSHIDMPAGTALFSYVASNGSNLTSPLSSTTAATVGSVVVTMVDDGGTAGPNETTLTQKVWIRSVIYGSQS